MVDRFPESYSIYPGNAYSQTAQVRDENRYTAATRYPGLRDAALVGRTEELRILTEALRRAADGNSSCVYLHGPPGIGKSRSGSRAN